MKLINTVLQNDYDYVSQDLLKSFISDEEFGILDRDSVFISVYSDGDFLERIYDVSFKQSPFIGGIEIDLENTLLGSGYTDGIFDLEVNFIRNLVGSQNDRLIINEISPSRTELRLNPLTNSSMIDSDQIRFGNYRQSLLTQKIDFNLITDSFVIPISNQTINSISNPSYPYDLIVKIPQPLDRSISQLDTCWIVRKVLQTYTVSVTLKSKATLDLNFRQLKPANFFIDVNRNLGQSTPYESTNDILNATSSIKNIILNQIFSGSIQGAALNIDHRQYENFIHFSSAYERLVNFVYKLKNIERLNSRLNELTSDYESIISYTASAGVTSSAFYLSNQIKYQRELDEIIGSFDHYEHYLYYESSSYESSSFGEFFPSTWPKLNSFPPYQLAPTTSSLAYDWLGNEAEQRGQYYSASLYDRLNPHALRNSIPSFMLNDELYNDYIRFVDMTGQHYDSLYLYIKNLGNINNRDEGVESGLSKDAIYEVLKSYGWTPSNGYQLDQLWSWINATDNSGSYSSSPVDGSTLIQARSQSLSSELIVKEVWKRTLTNLPFIYKTKGTERSIRALSTCYGVPATILRIDEFGGPEADKSGSSKVKRERFNFGLRFNGSSRITTNWARINTSLAFSGSRPFELLNKTEFDLQVPRTQHIRFKMTGSGTRRNQSLFGRRVTPSPFGGWGVWVSTASFSGSNKWGRVNFNLTGSTIMSMSTNLLPIYDGDWWDVNLRTIKKSTQLGDQGWELRVYKTSEFSNGDITHSGSANLILQSDSQTSGSNSGSYLASWTSSLTAGLRIGGWNGANDLNLGLPSNRFSGSLQEFRQYQDYIPDSILKVWASSPTSYVGSHWSSSYELLVRRWPLGTDLNRWTGSYVYSTHPNQEYFSFDGTTSGSSGLVQGFYGTMQDWDEEYETYYTTVPDIVSSRPIENKIRIEDNQISGTLSPIFSGRSIQTSSFDSHPLDSNRLSVAISPTNQINLDIAYQFGGLSVDDFVGDPRDRYEEFYTDLNDLRTAYFKKYTSGYSLSSFLRLMKFFDHTLFDQIEKLVPARANAFIGVLIEPTILERPKYKGNRPEILDLVYTSSLPSPLPIISSSFPTADLLSGYYDSVYDLSRDADRDYEISGSLYEYDSIGESISPSFASDEEIVTSIGGFKYAKLTAKTAGSESNAYRLYITGSPISSRVSFSLGTVSPSLVEVTASIKDLTLVSIAEVNSSMSNDPFISTLYRLTPGIDALSSTSIRPDLAINNSIEFRLVGGVSPSDSIVRVTYDSFGSVVTGSRLGLYSIEAGFFSSSLSHALDMPYSTSYEPAEFIGFYDTQRNNLYYDGCVTYSELLTVPTSSISESQYFEFKNGAVSKSIYLISTDTPDNRPIIETFTVDPTIITVGGVPGGYAFGSVSYAELLEILAAGPPAAGPDTTPPLPPTPPSPL